MLTSEQGTAQELGPVEVERRAPDLLIRNGAFALGLDTDGGATVAGTALRLAPGARGLVASPSGLEVTVETATLVRAVATGTLGTAVAYDITWDVHQTRNVHVYVRLRAREDVVLEDLALPALGTDAAAAGAGRDRWAALSIGSGLLGVVVKKLPWRASWNDVGAHDHGVLADAALELGAESALRVPGATVLRAGQTVEAALFLRPGTDVEEIRHEADYERLEARYIPEGEHLHTLAWENASVWMGPPIFEGAPQRPADQLVPRVLGLDVLARKRFTWNNEDFSLWRLTGKDRYRESGVKKAFALLETQNEHGGWFEGIEFYNLPPQHHHMYDTYIAGIFLLDAYDATGEQAFLDAAGRCVRFWLGTPPANGHTEEEPGAWWYRWGGYINAFGYTDERRVLNTHAGATAFLALYHERTGDAEARAAAQAGIEAFKLGLQRGIQRGDGQFLYCLSQIDPTLERPGDPPYIKLDLVPQIEDVYTVASSYRLMLANRLCADPEVTAAVRRALDYWWTGYRAGRVYTYRAYAAIAFALAAGEIDLRYALALPEILRVPDHMTSMQQGMSAFIAPLGLPGLRVRTGAGEPSFVEPVFLRRTEDEYLVALVNLEYAVADLTVSVELPAGAACGGITLRDPADLSERTLDVRSGEGTAAFTVPKIGEFGVTVVSVRLRAS